MTEYQGLFACLLSKSNNKSLAEEISPYAKKYLTKYNSLKKNKPSLANDSFGYNNTYKFTRRTGYGFQDVPESINLTKYILDKSLEFYHEMGIEVDRDRLSLQIFISEMVMGDEHKVHIHPNCSLSGVFYLSIPPDTAPISFPDPRGDALHIHPPYGRFFKETNYVYPENNYAKLIYPATGDLLIWNSWMRHSVPPLNFNKTEGRLTAVFNIIQKGIS